MIQNYIQNVNKDEIQKQEDFWDNYLDKQLKHLVLEFSFDFERIALALKNMNYKNSEKFIDQDKCQMRWAFLHSQRKKKLSGDSEEIIEETAEQKFNKLMSQPQVRENFNIFDNKVDSSNIPSGFNIFKDSIRGAKDKELAKEKEKNFLKNLDNILLDDEESKIDKPLLFKAEFLDDKSICFSKEILSKEKADEILSKKIDWSKISKEYNPEEKLENPEFSKNINNILLKETEVKTEEISENINKNNVEIIEEGKTNEFLVKEEIIELKKDDLQEKFDKIEQGFFTIEDVIEDLEKLNQDVQVNEIPQIQSHIDQKPNEMIPININELKPEAKSDFSSLKQILIMKEIENFTDKKDNNKELENFNEENASFSEESVEEDEDYYLEIQRLQIKEGPEAIISEKKSKKKRKKSKKVRIFEENKENQSDLPLIEKMIQEKQKSKKSQENLEKNDFFECPAGERFKQQLLLEEMERKKNAERQKDLEEMKRLQEKFQNDIDDNKRKKKEKKMKEAEEQAIHVAEQKKLLEKQQKELDEKRKQALENYQKEFESSQKQSQIFEKMKEVVNNIKNFNSGTSLGNLFEESISVMKPILSIPEEVSLNFKDFKEYEISRHGITKRYQILIFPYIDERIFLSEFLNYFLKNSSFTQETIPNLKKNYFPFYLLGLHISAYTPAISDEDNDLFCISNYLQNQNELLRQIDSSNMKRCIYMLFDTYVGEGSQILGDVVLDAKICNILSEFCVKKLKRKNIYDFTQKTTLRTFAIKHLKSMKLACKLFNDISTFHPISLRKNIVFDEKFFKSNEIGQLFMRILSKESFFCEDKEKSENILHYLLERTFKKGLYLIGMKTVYINHENFQEFTQTFEKSKFFEINAPFIVLAFSGIDAISKLEKIVGSNDIFLAKKLDQKSINALYFDKREDTFHYFLNKNLNKRLLSYFFGGRLYNYNENTFERIVFETKTEKRFSLFPDTIEYHPLFQIITPPMQFHGVILSPIFTNISQIIQLIQKYGFIIKLIRTISNETLFKNILEDDDLGSDLKQFLNDENLNKFCFEYEEEIKLKNSIFLIIEGSNFDFLKKKFLKKVIIHKKEFYPSIKHLIYHTDKNENVDFLEKLLQSSTKLNHHNFTKCISVPHFIAIWPLIDQQTDLLHIAKDLEFFKENNFELLGINSISNNIKTNGNSFMTIFKEELNKNLKFSTFVKKKSEYYKFLEYLTSFVLESKKLVCAFRFQGSDEDISSNQIFENKIFENSLQKCSDTMIYSITNKKAIGSKIITESELEYRSHIFHQNFDIIFLKIDLEKIIFLSNEMNLELTDDASISNSVIYDFNYKSLKKGNDFSKALLMINENSLKILSFYGILKRLENENFDFDFIAKINSNNYQDFLDFIWSNVKSFVNITLKKENKNIDNIKLEREKNEFLMKFLNSINGNLWVFILNSENAVYKCKKLATFFVKTLEILKNQKNEKKIEKMDFLNLKKLQLIHGIYCPLNFENNMEEIEMLEQTMKSQSSQNISNCNDTILIKQNSNLTCFLIKINTPQASKEMSQIIQNLNQSKFKILDIIISSNESLNKKVLESLELFNQNFTQNSLSLYWKNNSDGLVCVLLADCTEILSMNELFGSYRLDAFGKIIRMDKGKMMTVDENHFIIYSQKSEKILTIIEKVFA